MAYMLDAMLILLMVLFVYWGIKRGFARTVIILAGSLAALILAGALCQPVAKSVFRAVLRSAVISGVQERLASAMTNEDILAEVSEAVDALPFSMGDRMEEDGTLAELQARLTAKGQTTAYDAAVAACDIVIEPLVVMLLSFLFFIIAYILLMIAARMLARVIDRVFDLPVLHQLNALCGGLLGVVHGLIWCVALTLLAMAYIAISGDHAIFNAQDIRDSRLMSVLADWLTGQGFVARLFDALPKPGAL